MSLTDRITAKRGALLVVDLQEKLVAAMKDRESVVANVMRLVQGAEILKIPVAATEQYPEKLGPTVTELVAMLPERWPKTAFHCCELPAFRQWLDAREIHQITVVGIEAHVCIAQTALELINLGLRVQVPADAVASRQKIDRKFALKRLDRAGVVISTTEAVLFEWVERSDCPEFKAISALVKARDGDSRKPKI